jgi:hypothetical protein
MQSSYRDIDRRGFLGAGLSALPAALGWSLFSAKSAEASAAKAKACVWLWLNGGPSHIDTFDPKPGTSSGGPFKAIRSRIPGVQICEHMPMLADRASDLAIVRSMTSREGNHDRARYLVHSGYAPTPTVLHPSLGSWTAEELEHPDPQMPAFVSIGGPSQGAGFLGVQHGPFVVGKVSKALDNIELPTHVDPARFQRRQDLLATLETSFGAATGDRKVEQRQAVYRNAVGMMRSKHLAAFDVSGEPDAVKSAYGDHDFGRGCLMARRLVEAGVGFVEVSLDGWDTHKDNFGRTKTLMGMLDSGASTLLRDLSERHLLASTLVVIAGEFGRTPTINGNDGRDHHPKAWSAVLAGGGVRGGQAYGQTNADGSEVAAHPVSVADFFATLTTCLGLDPTKIVDTPVGRPISLTDGGKPIADLLAS